MTIPSCIDRPVAVGSKYQGLGNRGDRIVFEHHQEPIASTATFMVRLAGSLLTAILLIAVSLGMGVWGYHTFEGMSYIDAFANASMILSGMGPLTPMATSEGKIFAGIYALYSGFALLTVTAVTLAPVVHRFLHRLHIDVDEPTDKG
jgi:hypothetical protein